ncbi:MAG: serine/threonine protein kinase [Sedimentisphaerales bacterium]|nr:serine/threonine protein kinase [Sedimentisphaerales bacterium]
MSKDFTSGAEPEQLRQLFSIGMDESSSEKQTDRTASLDLFMEKPGSRLGRYQLLSVLGEGGMGMVYLAQQHQPVKRQVAVKIIKPGMDSKRVIARFEAERQALALLDHPHIAHVYDAGTTEAGRPYFVMEHVKGLPITEYCDHHKLTIEQRLRLFRQVCLALHHAHQKGIIHRDIKPSNILVSTQDDEAVPKIIDFGVAKAIAQPLTERTLATEDSQLLGTPEYMSPEQADMSNEDIDTRSDVYSLGVLLYVLLTGVLPFDSETLRTGGIERIRQIIRETDPKTPSTRLNKLGEEAAAIAQNRRMEIKTLAKHLRKELEWIPLKAMRKDRVERYRSASELADDIENYLNGEPLIAGPPSTIYRAKKFVRRNRALVTSVAAIIAVLAAGVVVSILFALKAQRQARISEAVSNFLRDDLLASVDPAKGKGRDVTIRSFLDTASISLNGKFTYEPLVEASIRDTLGWTYRQLGELGAAEPHLERALQIHQRTLGDEHSTTLNSMDRLAWLRWGQGRNKEAAELLEEGMAISRRVLGDNHVITLSLTNTLGCVYGTLGHYEKAEKLYLEGIRTARGVLDEKTDLYLFMVGNLGGIYSAQGRYDEAERQYLETLRLREGFWDDENIWTLVYKNFLAGVYREQKQYEEAERLYLEILPIQRRVNGPEHWRTLRSVRGLAQVYTHIGEYEKAEKLFKEELRIQQSGQGTEQQDPLQCMNGLAELYTAQGRFDEAKSLLTNALEISRRTLADDHPLTLILINGLAVVYKEQGDYEKAELLLIQALEGRRLKLGDTHPHTQESLNNLIDLYDAWGKPEQAEQWRERLPIDRHVK